MQKDTISSSVGNVKCHGTKAEEHDSDCQYKRLNGNIGGREIYFHIRVCTCGKHSEKTQFLTQTLNVSEEDGKEIHFNEGCKWIPQSRGDKSILLTQFCICKQPQVASTSANINCGYKISFC